MGSIWVLAGIYKINIVIIYEIKSFYVILAAGIFFLKNIHPASYHFTYSKKIEKIDNTTVLPLDGIVYRKTPQPLNGHSLRWSIHPSPGEEGDWPGPHCLCVLQPGRFPCGEARR
jgi:hypothetical protein